MRYKIEERKIFRGYTGVIIDIQDRDETFRLGSTVNGGKGRIVSVGYLGYAYNFDKNKIVLGISGIFEDDEVSVDESSESPFSRESVKKIISHIVRYAEEASELCYLDMEQHEDINLTFGLVNGYKEVLDLLKIELRNMGEDISEYGLDIDYLKKQ